MIKKKIIPSVGVVAIRDDEVLLVKELEGSGHISGVFGLPSGRVNDDETEQEAAAREFHEETGLNAKVVDFREFKNNYFVADIPRKDGTIKTFGWRGFKVQNFYGQLSGNDETHPYWVDLDKLKTLDKKKLLLPNVIEIVNNALE